MTALSPARFRLALVALFAGVVALTMLLFSGVVHAAPAGDPIAVAQGGVESAWATLETYGPLWGGALLAFAGVGALLRRNESTHWIAQGRALAVITTASMMLGAVLTWRFRGGDTAGLLMSLYAAVLSLIHPTVTAPADAPAKAPQSGRAGVVLMMLLAIAGSVGLGTISSCTAVKSAGSAVIDCTMANQPAIEALILEFRSLLQGQAPDWAAVEARAITAGETIGGCALAELIAGAAKPAGARSVDPGRATLEDFRAHHAGGATFHTAAGDL